MDNFADCVYGLLIDVKLQFDEITLAPAGIFIV